MLQQANSFLGPDKNGIINTDQEMDHRLMFGQDHGIKGKNANKHCSLGSPKVGFWSVCKLAS